MQGEGAGDSVVITQLLPLPGVEEEVVGRSGEEEVRMSEKEGGGEEWIRSGEGGVEEEVEEQWRRRCT